MVSKDKIKELRFETGVSIAECKKALEDSAGDFEQALKILRSRGSAVAAKKSSRETRAGVIDSYIHAGGRIGVIVELLCETDFVARNENFRSLAHDLAMQIAAANPADKEELLASPFIKDESKSIKDLLDEHVAVLGENINIGRFSRIEL